MSSEKPDTDHLSAGMADGHNLQDFDTNDDVAPEIIGMSMPNLDYNEC